MEQTRQRAEREAPEQTPKGQAGGGAPGGRRLCAQCRWLCRALARADGFVRAHTPLVIGLCLLCMAAVATLKFRVYSPEQFYDANGVLNAVNAGGRADVDQSFGFTIRAFLLLRGLFGALSLEQWGYVLLVPGALAFALLVWKARPQNLCAALLLLCFSVLLPFFVFTVGKDMLQYLAFFLVALALLYIPAEWGKISAAAALLAPVALLFRSYYALMIALMLLVFLVMRGYRAQRGVKRRALLLCAAVCAVVAGLFLLRALLPETADALFTIRSATNYAMGKDHTADKVILDVLPFERSAPGFLVNYCVAAVRMLLPFELCASPGDILFVLFELLLVGLLAAGFVLSRRGGALTAVYAAIAAFFLMSFFFEPDFGSWFRHQAAAFPLLWLGVGRPRAAKEG